MWTKVLISAISAYVPRPRMCRIWSVSDGVGLLNWVDIQSFKPNQWFDVPFQCMQFSQSEKNQNIECIRVYTPRIKFQLLRVEIKKCSLLALYLYVLPSNLSSSSCFFSHPAKFSVTASYTEHIGVTWVQPMEGSLRLCP